MARYTEDELLSILEYSARALGASEEEIYEFTRCQRPDGSFYGTRGKCKKGTESSLSSQSPKTGGGSPGKTQSKKGNFSLKLIGKKEPMEGTDVKGRKWKIHGVDLAVHDPKTGKRLGTIQTTITRNAGRKPTFQHILRIQDSNGKRKAHRLPPNKSPLESLNQFLSRPNRASTINPDGTEYEPYSGNI